MVENKTHVQLADACFEGENWGDRHGGCLTRATGLSVATLLEEFDRPDPRDDGQQMRVARSSRGRTATDTSVGPAQVVCMTGRIYASGIILQAPRH